MASDHTEAIFFVEALRPRIVFPDAKPHDVAALGASSFETGLHQRLPDSLPEKFLVRIEAGKLDWTLPSYTGLDIIDDDLRIARGVSVDLRDQKDVFRICKLFGDLLLVERLTHVVIEIVGGVFRVVGEGIPEGRVRKVG